MSHKPTTTAAILLATVGVSLLAGCSNTDNADHRVHRQAIMGGSTDNANTSVLGILIDLGGGQQAICSGTLIAPNLVLTAQHCVAQLASPYVVCGQAAFGTQFPPSSFGVTTSTQMSQNPSDSIYRSVSAVHVPPGGNDACGFDIALLELTDNVPANVTEPVIPRIDDPITEGESYTAVGYGHVGDGTGSGLRRQLGSREVLCGTGMCSIGDGIESTEFAGTDGTCQGDSGGAAIDNQGRVLGALSRGPDGCLGSVYSSVDAWAGWMRNIGNLAADNGAYDPAPWVELGISELPENDPDLDGILDPNDNCPTVANPEQADLDNDGMGDECDVDIDGDGRMNEQDNCPLYANPQQYDNDEDDFGDVCDQDDDNDGVMDESDNCQFMPNSTQADVCYGNTTFTPNPSSGTTAPAQAGEPQIVIVDEPDSVHATGRACAGAANASEFGFFFLMPLLLRVRRRLLP